MQILEPQDSQVLEKSYTLKDWQGGYESLTEEYDYWIDDIEGEIPPNLSGTLFRGVHLHILYVHLYVIRMHIYYMYYI